MLGMGSCLIDRSSTVIDVIGSIVIDGNSFNG